MPEEDLRFLELTFDGGRFAAHAVPIDVLAELATFQQLLVRVARTIFFQRHQDRHRVPRGFQEAAQLYLTSSEPNCFTAGLSRPGAWLGDAEDAGIFDQARDLSIRALALVGDGQDLPSEFPSDAIDLLAALGQRLNNDEELLVRTRRDVGTTARVSQRTRARLALITKRSFEREEGIDGEVEKVDDAADRFTLRTRVGTRVDVPFSVIQRAAVMEALELRPIARVRVRGLLAVAAQKLRMKSVTELEVVDDERAPDVLRVWKRLDDLRALSDGWLEGDGVTPDAVVVARAREVLARLLVDYRDLPRPKVFPTPDGGIQLEWTLGDWGAELVFEPDEEGVVAEATNVETGEEREELFVAGQVTADSTAALNGWLAALR